MALKQAGRDAIARGIRDGKPFSAGKGKSVSGATYLRGTGRMPSGETERYLLERNSAGYVHYVIYSYATPIAFQVETPEGNAWIVPPFSYSVTTTNHQNVVRTSLHFAGWVESAPGIYRELVGA